VPIKCSLLCRETTACVETLDRVAKLREAGCTQIQGYVFSRPRPSAEIAALFGRRLEGDENEGVGTHVEKVRAGVR